MFSKPQKQMIGPYCSLCYRTDKLSRCSRCSNAYYCCREHQIEHWKVHSKNCMPSLKINQQTENSVLSNQLAVTIDPNDAQSAYMQSTHIVQPQYRENTQSQFTPDVQHHFRQDIQAQFSPSVQQQQTYSSWLSCNTDKNTSSASSPDIIYSPEQLSPDVYSNSECYLPPVVTSATVDQVNENSNSDNFYAASGSTLNDTLFVENNDLFSSLTNDLLTSTNNYWDIINSFSNIENVDFNCDLDVSNTKQHMDEKVVENAFNLNIDLTSSPVVTEIEPSNENLKPEKILLLEDVCQNVVHDLNEYGICVIDDFLGPKVGNAILTEVKCMFLKGLFKQGELVSTGMWCSNDIIRGDVITWVDGTESGCYSIGYLIKKLDLVMAACNRMPDNGILQNYKLNRRTKAMIACYPGNGTYYKRHIDNPNSDGRCITCIYYLNKNWDIKNQGGLLRMFPVGHESEVANIEPIFDRMLFFWSDKRNPHEVLPSFAVRFAITVWYFDADERDKALQEKQPQKYT